ncbi:MAG: deoxyribose-phosphate aldolase [Treponema sp.]|jgi:deoxyribose-phosphate aldolase|nr:deoxyribose-phosphate aldolase [Treponema sp.]
MTNEEILSHIDHTLLKAAAAWPEIEKLCEEALAYKTASVCIPPCYVERAYRRFGGASGGLNIGTVIGFPLGYNSPAVKIREAEEVLARGAGEIDMVINLGDVKNGSFEKVEEEIRTLKKAAGARILKVIVETCYLTEEEKIRLCGITGSAGADYIKTSTGFGAAGAAAADIELFRKHIPSGLKIKAAGGIKTREAMEAFLALGCDRIGASSAVALLAGTS